MLTFCLPLDCTPWMCTTWTETESRDIVVATLGRLVDDLAERWLALLQRLAGSTVDHRLILWLFLRRRRRPGRRRLADIATSATITADRWLTTGLVHIWHNDGTPLVGRVDFPDCRDIPAPSDGPGAGRHRAQGSSPDRRLYWHHHHLEDHGEHDVPYQRRQRLLAVATPRGRPLCFDLDVVNRVHHHLLGQQHRPGRSGQRWLDWTSYLARTTRLWVGTTWPDTTGFYDGPAYQVRACRNLGDPYSPAGWQAYDVGRDDAPVSNSVLGHTFWGAHIWSVAVGDLDNDGNLDIVSGGGAEGDYQILVYENDGDPFDNVIWQHTAVGYGSRYRWWHESFCVAGW